MKRTLFLTLAIAFLFGCGKDSTTSPASNTPNNNTPTDSSSMQFTIEGVVDMTFGKDSMAIMAIGVNRQNSVQERVTLSLTGLPANVNATFSSESGTPDFATSLTLKATGAVPGTYPVKLLGITAGNVTKSYDFNIIITGQKPGDPDPILGCVKELLGNYRSDYIHNGQPNVYEFAKVESTGVKNEIKISLAVFNRKQVTATIDCDTKQLTIPDHPDIDWNLTNATGYLGSDGKIHVSYTMSGSGPDQPVTEVLTKK